MPSPVIHRSRGNGEAACRAAIWAGITRHSGRAIGVVPQFGLLWGLWAGMRRSTHCRDIKRRRRPGTGRLLHTGIEDSGASRTVYKVGVAADGSIPEALRHNAPRQNLQARLCAAGMRIESLVKITTIIPNLDGPPAVRAGRAEVLGAHRPASTLIVGGIAHPAWKVEVEGIAVA